RIGDDERDRLADVENLAPGERGPEGLLLLLPADAVIGHAARQRLPARGRIVLAGEDEAHAFSRPRASRVDRGDLRVRAVRPQEERVELPGKIPVRGVAPAAGQKPRILAAYCFFAHRRRRIVSRRERLHPEPEYAPAGGKGRYLREPE